MVEQSKIDRFLVLYRKAAERSEYKNQSCTQYCNDSFMYIWHKEFNEEWPFAGEEEGDKQADDLYEAMDKIDLDVFGQSI